jgi:hypothetical protein
MAKSKSRKLADFISDSVIDTAELADGSITTAKLADDSVTAAKIAGGAAAVSDQINSSTGYFDVPAGTTAQRPASPNNGMIRFNTETLKIEGYTSLTSAWGGISLVPDIWVADYATPDGGVQSCRFINDDFGTWVLVGRFAASAKDAIQSTWSSVRGLSTSTSQSQATEFSADFGTATPSEVRILGATDFDNWKTTKTIDWVYKVPTGRQWKYFFTSGNASGMAQGGDIFSNNPRWGFECAGAYDGKGRWVNNNYNFMRMADLNQTISASAFSTPTSNAFYWNGSGDAKLGVHHSLTSSGQDAEDTAELGSDDTYDLFYDYYPNTASATTYPVDYSSAVWVLIKVS